MNSYGAGAFESLIQFLAKFPNRHRDTLSKLDTPVFYFWKCEFNLIMLLTSKMFLPWYFLRGQRNVNLTYRESPIHNCSFSSWDLRQKFHFSCARTSCQDVQFSQFHVQNSSRFRLNVYFRFKSLWKQTQFFFIKKSKQFLRHHIKNKDIKNLADSDT